MNFLKAQWFLFTHLYKNNTILIHVVFWIRSIMNNLCLCGCGQFVDLNKKYIYGHQGVGRVLSYKIPKTKKCNRCCVTLNIDNFSFRNLKAKNGLEYMRPRSKCKKCESLLTCKYQSQPKIRERIKRSRKNDRSLKSLIQNRIAAWKKKTSNSDLTTEYLLKQHELQEGKCYYTGLPLVILKTSEWKDDFENSISLDRLIPDKGYVQGNVVFCLYSVNTMKGRLTEQEFYSRMQQILQNRGCC